MAPCTAGARTSSGNWASGTPRTATVRPRWAETRRVRSIARSPVAVPRGWALLTGCVVHQVVHQVTPVVRSARVRPWSDADRGDFVGTSPMLESGCRRVVESLSLLGIPGYGPRRRPGPGDDGGIEGSRPPIADRCRRRDPHGYYGECSESYRWGAGDAAHHRSAEKLAEASWGIWICDSDRIGAPSAIDRRKPGRFFSRVGGPREDHCQRLDRGTSNLPGNLSFRTRPHYWERNLQDSLPGPELFRAAAVRGAGVHLSR